MHVILLRFGTHKGAAKDHMAAHNAWIDQGVDDGIFQCVGSLEVGGGFILAHGEADADLRRRVATDPFVVHGVVTAEILQVTPNRVVPPLAFLKAAG